MCHFLKHSYRLWSSGSVNYDCYQWQVLVTSSIVILASYKRLIASRQDFCDLNFMLLGKFSLFEMAWCWKKMVHLVTLSLTHFSLLSIYNVFYVCVCTVVASKDLHCKAGQSQELEMTQRKSRRKNWNFGNQTKTNLNHFLDEHIAIVDFHGVMFWW